MSHVPTITTTAAAGAALWRVDLDAPGGKKILLNLCSHDKAKL